MLVTCPAINPGLTAWYASTATLLASFLIVVIWLGREWLNRRQSA
jgi:hypothetical protein